jgi:hypothetical protein
LSARERGNELFSFADETGGIIPARRKNQLMKRCVRRERNTFSTGGRQSSNHQNAEMLGTDPFSYKSMRRNTQTDLC